MFQKDLNLMENPILSYYAGGYQLSEEMTDGEYLKRYRSLCPKQERNLDDHGLFNLLVARKQYMKQKSIQILAMIPEASDEESDYC